MRSRFGPLIILLLLVTAASAETRIFELSHRRAADVADAVRAVLDADARVTAVDQTLVISAPPSRLADIAELIARLDRPARMLRVSVGQQQQDTSRGASGGSSIQVSSGDATVIVGSGRSPVHPSRTGGATVVLGGDHGRIVASGQAGSRVESHRVEQFLVTLEGSPARIGVGRRVPVTERWLDLTRRHAQVTESVRYESVDTGFEVVPTLFAGGQVELVIHPFMAYGDPHRGREVRFSDLTTTVRIRLGEWFDLGGTMAARDEVSREILGIARESGEGGGNVRVRVELQPE